MSSNTRDNITNLGSYAFSAGYSDAFTIQCVRGTITGMSGATVSCTNIIPAGAMVFGVTLVVTTLITMGAGTTFTIGDGSVADRWGSGIVLALGTKTTGTAFKASTAPYQAYPSATSVVLTGTGGSFTAGAVSLVVTYASFTAPSQ
jgi:hypothetical protein